MEDNFKFEKPEDDENDSMLKKIGESIVRQMDSDLETMTMVEDAELKGLPVRQEHEAGRVKKNAFLRLWQKLCGGAARLPIWVRIVIITAASAALLFMLLFWTPLWRMVLGKFGSEYVSGQVNYVPVAEVERQEPEDDVDEATPPPEVTEEPVMTVIPVPSEEPEDDPDIRNILLLGEEAIGAVGLRGRTDLMMIATLNKKNGELGLTTLMRDMLVSIPGYDDNKLNVAYQIGGVKLLYETLEYNLNIRLDNYALVDFEGFETIIDELGGVEITLTEEEAEYLNRTNYISKPEYRTVTAGVNEMNGNQALGYCRIRAVPTAEGEYSDFGRTSRQKKLLTSIFDRFNKLGFLDLLSIANKCLPLITTDLQAGDVEDCLNLAYDIGMNTDISMYRIPVSGGFREGYIRKMSVIIPDMVKNREALRLIMYGEKAEIE